MRQSHRRCAVALALSLMATPCAFAETKAAPISIAVLDFDYFDTSGEDRNQVAEHGARLESFMKSLRRDLEKEGAYKVVTLDCGSTPCTARSLPPQELFEAAKKARARLLLYGGVHKMSTLVQWAQAQLVDVEKNRLIDDRRLSFRGDDDQSWRRAEAYLAAKLNSARLSSSDAPREGAAASE